MSKRIAILQSNYIPWKGYFDIIGLVDEFIIYDEVQYTKNDWRNRNKIKTASGTQWITIPVYQRSLRQKISETVISDPKWGMRNWNSLKTNYGRAPYFKSYSSAIQEIYLTSKSLNLSEINVAFIRFICDFLGIKTKISNSADYVLEGDSTEKLVSLCRQTRASHYLSGPAAKVYILENLFQEEKINIEWMDYNGYQEYPQLYPPFEQGVSIIDLLFNAGPASRDYMKFSK